VTAKGSNLTFHGKNVKVRNRRVSPIVAHSGDCLLSEPIAGTQPYQREPLFMPQTCRSQDPPGLAQLGGLRTFVNPLADA